MAGSLGGRPKADIWKHVTILDEKRVKCKYCELVFAKSANRIKSHVSQTEGKGIRVCPQFPQTNTDSNKRFNSNTSSGNLKENLSDSQGSRNLDRPSDHTKFNEKMLDCYMSPKTMWEGMTQQQVQMKTKTKQQEMKQVGPFSVSNTVDARDLQLIEYVFDPSLAQWEIIVDYCGLYLTRKEFTTLAPQSLLDSMIINIFAEYFTDIERKKKNRSMNWYLPIPFSTSALTSDVKSFLSIVERQKMREKYMSKLVDCEKIFIPIHTDKGCGHFYLYVIHLKTKEIEIWNSFPSFTNEEEHRERTQKLLLALTSLFMDDIWESGQIFSNFHTTIAKDTPLQSNEYDCGIFVINFIQQSANANRNYSHQLFHGDEERLDLALKLLKSDLNKERGTLYVKAVERHSLTDEHLSGLKRKDIDICRGFPKDTQTEECAILDFSNKRVKNNIRVIDVQEKLDSSNSQVGLADDPRIPCLHTDLLGESDAAPLTNSADSPDYSFSSIYPCLSEDWVEFPLVEEDSEDILVRDTLNDGWVPSLAVAPPESVSSAFPFTVTVKSTPDVSPAVAPQEKPKGKLSYDWGELPLVEDDSEDMLVYRVLRDALNVGWVPPPRFSHERQ